MDLTLPQPYLLFIGDITVARYAKTAFGLCDWARDRCVGECVISSSAVTTGLPRMSPSEARREGARSLVIGAAPVGGGIAPAWVPMLVEALESGLDLISGLHPRLASEPEIAAAARKTGQRLIDVRTPPAGLSAGTGRKRSGQRLLTVGTDCALGKKYTALSLTREFKNRGVPVDFRATGQTGILIAGGGIPIDAVISDFESWAYFYGRTEDLPVVSIDNPSLHAIPGQRWQTALYVTNNSMDVVQPVLGCEISNGGRVVEETRVIVPAIGPGERWGVSAYGPPTGIFVDRVTCRVIAPP